MKIPLPFNFNDRRGSSVVVVLLLCTITLVIMASALKWTSTNTTLSQRNNEYYRTVAAAEAATEKVISCMAADYRNGGDSLVYSRSNAYKGIIPTGSENPQFSKYLFTDAQGGNGKVYIESLGATMFTNLSSKYKGLHGYATPFRIISNAKLTSDNSLYSITAAVRQDFELTTIPLFQFAIFYNLDLEINPGPDMDVTGPVHCNENIYICPGAKLTFHDDVTAAEDILNQRKDATCGNGGTIKFEGEHVGQKPSLNLPIGTNNTPTTVRQVVEVPPPGELANSDMGKERFYNKADMVITVANTNITVTSGSANSFSKSVPRDQFYYTTTRTANNGFLLTNSFFNKRENRTVLNLDIDIGRLLVWNATNTILRPLLTNAASAGNVSLIYVVDNRTQIAGVTQPGVRVRNGKQILPKGLTVATASPIYVWGHYNVPDPVLGKNDTTGTLPAALIGDAVTVLSTAWTDANSTLVLSSRKAQDTTVNAAFLAGIVETAGTDYSGGVENFPRFLEDWNGRKLTYNGSMVVMYPSKYAVALWGGTGDTFGIYNPPKREWAFDENFRELTKLPPGTPMMRLLNRSTWAMIKPNTTVVVGP